MGLLHTQRQHKALFVVIDILTKMAHFILTIKKVSTIQMTDLFIQHIFCTHGIPKTIVFNQDACFIGQS